MWTWDLLQTTLINWGILLGFCAALWLYCTSAGDTSIIDRYWGPMCAAPGLLTLVQTGVYSEHAIVLVLLSGVWALRLAWHITRRNWNAGEDFRYTEGTSPALTRASSPFRALFFVFFGQATLAWLVSAPVQYGQFYSRGESLSALAWLGIAVWGVGFYFEVVGDRQLRKFKATLENKGKIMTEGLWAWTRHPNYFGDSTVWFGLFLIALDNPLGIYSLYGPLILYYFLTRLTGKDLTERVMLARYPAYKEYIETTSAFFPLPPSMYRKGR